MLLCLQFEGVDYQYTDLEKHNSIVNYRRSVAIDISHTRLVTAEYFDMFYTYEDQEAKIVRFNGNRYKILIKGPKIVRVVKC